MDIKTLLTGALPLILILTAFFTALISLFLLYQYRRSVIRLMGKYAPQTSPPSPEQPSIEMDKQENPFPLEFIHINEAAEKIKPEAQKLYANLKRASWNNVLIYGLAGLGYAIIMSLALLLSSQTEIAPIRLLTIIWIYLFPAILTIYLVSIPDRKIRLIIPLVYFLIYLVIVLLGVFPNWNLAPFVFILIFQFNLPPSLLTISFLNRHTKAIAPLIMAFIFFAVAGIVLTLSYGIGPMAETLRYSNNWVVKTYISITRVISPSALVPISIALLTFLGMLVVGVFGILLLKWIKGQYQHKRVSDQSLLIDAIWVVFVLYQSVELALENPWWILSGLVAFLLFKTITKIGFFITKRKAAPEKTPQLLFLRVFSLGVESQKLYRIITAYWRHAGNALFITGPDLITSTVEPHDFLDYLVKKLPNRFVDSKETLDRQISEIDMEPDADGLYRIHDYFCYANT